MSSTLAGLLTVLLVESREGLKQFLMSSYVRFNCVGFLLPSRNRSLANVLLCTPTHRDGYCVCGVIYIVDITNSDAFEYNM